MSQPVVAVNAHLLSGEASYRSAGIAVYIEHLLRYLPRVAPELRYRVLLGRGRLPAEVTLPVSRSRWPTHRPPLRIVWEQLVLPWVLRRQRADLLHAPAFVAPLLTSVPTVITVHDLSFLRYPHFFRRSRQRYLSTMTPWACRRAEAVITGSEFSRREIVAALDVPPQRLHVVPYGVAARFRPLPAAQVAAFRVRRGLPERFILYLGTLEPRKNLPRLIRAFARLRSAVPEAHLVLAGGKGWFYQTIFAEVTRQGLQGRVHFPGFIPAEEQALWYNAATSFAYLSTYEGFGLPVLESLACGVPAVASNSTSLPEAAGGGALLVPPEDEEAITTALAQLWRDAELRASLRAQGLRHAARFSWERTASLTAEVYRKVLGQDTEVNG